WSRRSLVCSSSPATSPSWSSSASPDSRRSVQWSCRRQRYRTASIREPDGARRRGRAAARPRGGACVADLGSHPNPAGRGRHRRVDRGQRLGAAAVPARRGVGHDDRGGHVADAARRRGAAEVAARLGPHVRDLVRWLIAEAGSIGSLLVQFLLTVAVSGVLYSRGEAVAGGVLAFAQRLAGNHGVRAVLLSADAIRAVALGVVVTAVAQAVVGGIGLAVTGVPHPVLLTSVMLVLGIAQIGPGPVLFGSVIWLYVDGQSLWGTVMLLWALVTTSFDNILRPVLIKRGADLPLLLILAGVIGGLLAFGLVGLFIGPVILAVAYTLLVAWVTAGDSLGRLSSSAPLAPLTTTQRDPRHSVRDAARSFTP